MIYLPMQIRPDASGREQEKSAWAAHHYTLLQKFYVDLAGGP